MIMTDDFDDVDDAAEGRVRVTLMPDALPLSLCPGELHGKMQI
jgi:hypothetical protein